MISLFKNLYFWCLVAFYALGGIVVEVAFNSHPASTFFGYCMGVFVSAQFFKGRFDDESN